MRSTKSTKRRSLFLAMTIAFYVIIAIASTGGGSNPPICNEPIAVDVIIKVNWLDVQNYPQRLYCVPPNNYFSIPWAAMQNAPSENYKDKGIVTVTIELADPRECTLAKTYSTRQYYTTPNNGEDKIAEVPKKNIKILLEYQEACGNCHGGSNQYRAIFRSETQFAYTQVYDGAVLMLNTPQFYSVANSNCN